MPSASISSQASRPDRTQEIGAFLANIGWGSAERRHLAGDASFRRYERVFLGSQHAVLMDAPPPFEDVRPFIHVTKLLGEAGLSSPAIIAADAEQGFLLLEDLGDDSYSRVLKSDTSLEPQLYNTAMDALLVLQQDVVPRNIAPYDAAVYMRELALFSDWFMPQLVGLSAAKQLRAEYISLWGDVLSSAPLRSDVLVHRDYHADNLLWLPNREAALRVGMIDYQDALVGDAFYDVVSLLEDARTDVAQHTADEAFARFVQHAGVSFEEATLRYAVLGAQRNLKIIGIFTRLAVRDGKAHYLSFLPRVWGHLMRDIEHPALRPLKQFLSKYVPQTARGVITVDASLGALTV